MKRFILTVTITEHERVVEVEANSHAEARERARRGEWDTAIGASEPLRYTTVVNRCVLSGGAPHGLRTHS